MRYTFRSRRFRLAAFMAMSATISAACLVKYVFYQVAALLVVPLVWTACSCLLEFMYRFHVVATRRRAYMMFMYPVFRIRGFTYGEFEKEARQSIHLVRGVIVFIHILGIAAVMCVMLS